MNDRAANDAFRIGSNPMHRGAYNYTDDAGAGGSSGAAVDNVDVSRHSEVELRDETSITTETGAGDSFGGNSSNNAAMGSDSISMRNSFYQNTAPRASFTETMRSSISKMVGTGSAYTANNAGGPPPVALSRTSSYVPPKAGGSSVAGSSSTSGGSGGH